MEDINLHEWNTRMVSILDDIKNFRIVQSTIEKKLDSEPSIYFVNNDINSQMYVKLGFTNELGKSLFVDEPTNKWCGFYKNPLLIIEDIEYLRRSTDFTHPEFPMFDIVDFYKDSYNRIFYIIAYPSRKIYYETVKYQKKLKSKNSIIFINIKNNKCSCIQYKKFNKCKHYLIAKEEREQIRLMFGLVLRNFIGWTITKHILLEVNIL